MASCLDKFGYDQADLLDENGDYITDKLFQEAEAKFYDTGDINILWTSPAFNAMYTTAWAIMLKVRGYAYPEIDDDALDMVCEFIKTMQNKYKKGKRDITRRLISSMGFMKLRISNKEESLMRRGAIESYEEWREDQNRTEEQVQGLLFDEEELG